MGPDPVFISVLDSFSPLVARSPGHVVDSITVVPFAE